jgi:hypothetical protein
MSPNISSSCWFHVNLYLQCDTRLICLTSTSRRPSKCQSDQYRVHHAVQCSDRLSVRFKVTFEILYIRFYLPKSDNAPRISLCSFPHWPPLQARASTRHGQMDLCVPVWVCRCIPIGRLCKCVWMLRPECVRHHHTCLHGRSSSGTALIEWLFFTSNFCHGDDSLNPCTHTVNCTTDKHFQGFLTNDARRLVQISSVPRLASSTLCSTPANGIEPETSQQCVCFR